MTRVIIMGHGGYGSGVSRNIGMLVGAVERYHYIDFNETDSLEILRDKINEVLEGIGNDSVLFCCDLPGGSPFREAAMICLNHPDYSCVAGLNTGAYAEMSFNLELNPSELGKLGCDAAKESIIQFPVPEN